MNIQAPPSVLLQRRFFIFLACLALALMVFGWVATAQVGPGLASDSINYLAAAQNLLAGNGFFVGESKPLLSWPPLFPAVLAGVSWLTGLDIFVAGWYFNLLLLGVNLILSGILFWRVFESQPVYAYLGSLFVGLSISSLRIHANLFSEPLYLTMTLGFFLALEAYIRKRSRLALFWMTVLSALAPVLRYVGMAFVVVAVLVILIENRRDIRKLVGDAMIVGLISVLPIGWWLIIRNVMTYGTLFGTSAQTVNMLENATLGLTKMLHWVVPYLDPLMPVLTRPFLVLGSLAVLLWFINRHGVERFRAWWLKLSSPGVYPALLYTAVYFLAVIATSITADHRWLNDDDRYYVILLVPVVYLILLSFETLVQPHLRLAPRWNTLVLAGLFAVWSVYPIYGLREYLLKARELGEPSSYNFFNTRAWHDMPVVAAMQRLHAAEPTARLYSNYTDTVWFFTRKSAENLPSRETPEFETFYIGWPGERPGYLIWFKPNEYKLYLSPEELSRFAILELIYTDESGDIYIVKAR